MENYLNINKATLRLFKSIYVEEGMACEIPEDLIVASASKGLLLSNVTFPNTTTTVETIDYLIKLYGVDLVKLSNTFHKTWKTVSEIDPQLHYLQQILHYITTYGFEALGFGYDEESVYIPAEKVPYDENVKPYSFTIIRGINLDEMLKRVDTLLTSGVALSQQQVDDVVLLYNYITSKGYKYEFDNIKNKEVKAILWTKIEDKPYIPVDEFLRVLTYTVTGNTLLVRSWRNYQNVKLHMKINMSLRDNSNIRIQVKNLLEYYIDKFGMKNIASQFLRNKIIFLSFKCDETKSIINKLRREAKIYHEPQEVKYLDEQDIINANIWQLIKYYNYCLSNLNPTTDKLYQIRTGKNYIKENNNANTSGNISRVVDEHYTRLKNIITERIADSLSKLQGKIFLVPDYIDYRIPSSLKRLASGVPEGTIIKFPEDKPFTVGVHWENKPADKNHSEYIVDLDLHANSVTESYGWNRSFRSEEKGKVMYSGDVTSAPINKGGASEAFTFDNIDDTYIVTLNDYTQSGKHPYKFVFDIDTYVKDDDYRHESRGYIFSPNAKVLNAHVDNNQNTLGLVMKNKFYFINSSIFQGSITNRDGLLERLLKYYEESQANYLTFTQLADIVGFRVIKSLDELEVPEGEEAPEVINLSLENITEDTFPSLFE